MLTSNSKRYYNTYIYIRMKKYMYVELPEGVCCNIVTANKHIGISILRNKYYVPRPSSVKLKLNLQPNNRFIMEYSRSKISQKGIFFFMSDFIIQHLQ